MKGLFRSGKALGRHGDHGVGRCVGRIGGGAVRPAIAYGRGRRACQPDNQADKIGDGLNHHGVIGIGIKREKRPDAGGGFIVHRRVFLP